MSERQPRWVLSVNTPITRRKSYHHVLNPKGEAVFRHMRIWPCIEFLDAEGVEVYEMRPTEPKDHHEVRRVTVIKEQRQWQN